MAPGAVRIALIVAGELSPEQHSGTPAALARGFESCGHEVVPVEVEVPAAANRLVRRVIAGRLLLELRGSASFDALQTLALTTAEYCRLSSRQLARVWRARAVRADVLVQYGTTFLPPAGGRMVTYEDMTSVQAARYPYWPVGQLPRRALDRRIRHQGMVYARTTRCCATTEWPASSIVEDFGVDPSKVRVVGVGRNYRPEARTTRDWRRARYLFVGRDWERKNGPGLLEAFARVREHLPHAELDIVGPAAAPEPPGVRSHGNLYFSREQDRRRMESLYDTATCFVLPSLCEPSGVSYLEAMSAGLPVIVSAEGGSRYVVGEAGVVVDPRDVDGLAAAMIRLTDPAVAAPLASAALERAAAHDWTTVTRQMLADL